VLKSAGKAWPLKPPPQKTGLFDAAAKEGTQPLAARMRPATLEEFVGQEQLIAPGRALRKAIEADKITSAIFFGPAGIGKSTLAAIIAARTKAHFETFSAVTSGVADVRRVVAQAAQRKTLSGRPTILFVDEIHRFNKAQQDAFLPHVEDGTIVLIGATTENPYFSINAPLLSRSCIYRFQPLNDAQISSLLDRALSDEQRGLGKDKVRLAEKAREHILNFANGDARAALNALETAAALARPDSAGNKTISVTLAEEALQHRLLSYDKNGDTHYDVISAFIKSIRGSHPDAAIYWLARMITAGEDPRFIARRLIIHAAEDIGNADPMALLLANAAAHAVEYVGLPEAQIPLAQVTAYLASAPKSNSAVKAISKAMEDVAKKQAPRVPKHLRDASYPGARTMGHGEGYQYPHSFPEHFVPQQYLPAELEGQIYYQPSDSGLEKEIKRRLADWKITRSPLRRKSEGEHPDE
jgi:putative ATPase